MGASVTAPALALLLSRFEWDTAFWIIAVVGGIIVFSLLAKFHGEPGDPGNVALRRLRRRHPGADAFLRPRRRQDS